LSIDNISRIAFIRSVWWNILGLWLVNPGSIIILYIDDNNEDSNVVTILYKTRRFTFVCRNKSIYSLVSSSNLVRSRVRNRQVESSSLIDVKHHICSRTESFHVAEMEPVFKNSDRLHLCHVDWSIGTSVNKGSKWYIFNHNVN
jgi:hypothetical protein